MTKQKYERFLKYLAGVSLSFAVLFFLLMVLLYTKSEIFEPFFIAFLVIAFHCGYRLILGVAEDYDKEHHFNWTKFPFKKTGLDKTLIKLCKAQRRKSTILVDREYARKEGAIQHYCMAELLHLINIVLTLLTFFFCFFTDNHLVSFLVILGIALVFLAYEMVPLMANRYSRFLLTGELEESTEAKKAEKAKRAEKAKKTEPLPEKTVDLKESAAFAGLAAMGSASVAKAEEVEEPVPKAEPVVEAEPAPEPESVPEAEPARDMTEKDDSYKDISSGSERRRMKKAKLQEEVLEEDAKNWRKANGVAEPIKLSNPKNDKKKGKKSGKKTGKQKVYISNEDLSFNALAAALGHKDTDADFVSGEETDRQKDHRSGYQGVSAPTFGSRSSSYWFPSDTMDDEEI